MIVTFAALLVIWAYTLMGAGFALGFMKLTDAQHPAPNRLVDIITYVILVVVWPLACGLYIGGGTDLWKLL